MHCISRASITITLQVINFANVLQDSRLEWWDKQTLYTNTLRNMEARFFKRGFDEACSCFKQSVISSVTIPKNKIKQHNF